MIEKYIDANDFILKKGKELLESGEQVDTTNFKNEGTLKNKLYELAHQFFEIENPKATLFDIAGFKTTPFWMAGELLTEFLNKNPPVMIKYKEDVIHQSYEMKATGDVEYSYGSRWKEFNQILHAYDILKKNPNSKRVIIQTWMPWDIDINKSDVPCNINYMFLSRNGKLDMTATIRSNDILRGTKYDYALASFMLQSLASWTNLEVGGLYFSINSLHIYEKDGKKLEEVLNNEYSPSPQMIIPSNLKIEDYWHDFRHVEKAEEASYHSAFDYFDKYLSDMRIPFFRDLARIYGIRNARFVKNTERENKYKSDVETEEMKRWLNL